MVDGARERIAVAHGDAGVVAQAVGDVHRAGAGDGFVGVCFSGADLGNEEDVLEAVFIDELLALLDDAYAV